MVRTIVCQEEGCSGSTFHIEAGEKIITLTCDICGGSHDIEYNYYDYILLSSCSKCNNNTFKVFKNLENKSIYAKCIECGATPEKIYIDSNGVQVSYETKVLDDVKSLMYRIEQRMVNLEVKIQDVERGQEMTEQSLAYINRYIVDKD